MSVYVKRPLSSHFSPNVFRNRIHIIVMIFMSNQILFFLLPSSILWCHDDVTKRKYFRVTGPLRGEFTDERSVTRSFDVFFDLRLNKRLRKQSRRWSDWRSNRVHYDVTVMSKRWVGTEDAINEDSCARSSYQGQVQVIVSHSFCGMYLCVTARDTCFWQTNLQTILARGITTIACLTL